MVVCGEMHKGSKKRKQTGKACSFPQSSTLKYSLGATAFFKRALNCIRLRKGV
jgi:hypothetical protein